MSVLLLRLFFVVFTVFFGGTALAESVRPFDWADVAEVALQSTVNVYVVKEVEVEQPIVPMPDFPEFYRFFGVPQVPERRRGGAMGSGFFVTDQGHIVTNYHVVSDAVEISVTTSDNKAWSATLVGGHQESDLAVLKLDDPSEADFVVAKWDDSDKVRVGNPVMVVGNLNGLWSSVTAGVVSARARATGAIQMYDSFIQTDANIDRGNSGGPLLNSEGKVIGVNTLMAVGQSGRKVGMGFAIPSNWAMLIVDQLIEKGRVQLGAIGVHLNDVAKEVAEVLGLKEARGALVVEVLNDTPAQEAGLRKKDVILKFGDNQINSARDLKLAVPLYGVGEKVPVLLWRDGREVNSILKVGSRGEIFNQGSVSGMFMREYGLRIGAVTEAQRKENDFPDIYRVFVKEVTRGGVADRSGLITGDILLEVGDRRIDLPQDVMEALNQAKENGQRVMVLVVREGYRQFYAVLDLRS